MSVLIMEMPNEMRTLTVFPNGYVAVYNSSDTFIGETKAIQIPPHGRLIDADELALIVQKWRYMYKRLAEETNDDDIVAMAVAIHEFLNSVSLTLGKMQTIIPADKEG